MTKLERSLSFGPAYDKRNDDPAKNYGVGCVNIVFLLKGEKGAVQFGLLTGWYTPEVTAGFPPMAKEELCRPLPSDVSYHSPVPQYEGQKPIAGTCDVLGSECYSGSSTLAADDVFALLLAEGHEGVWRALEKRYAKLFEEGSGHFKL